MAKDLDALAVDAALLAQKGEMSRLIAEHDWGGSSLGPIETWPPSLMTTVGLMVHSPVPMVLLWGEDGVMTPIGSLRAGGTLRCLAARSARAGPRSPISTTTS